MRWRLIVHEEAVEFMLRQRGSRLRTLRAALDSIAQHPFQDHDACVRGDCGRLHSVRQIQAWRITYWLDVFVHQVRIVEIDRV